MKKLDCVQKALEKLYYKYGKLVGRKPLPFIIVPIMVTLFSTIGFLRFSVNNDPEYLYTPVNGEGKIERSIFNESFPVNEESRFIASRKLTEKGTLYVILRSKVLNENIFTKAKYDEVIKVDKFIKSIKYTDRNNEEINYDKICAKWNGSCSPNLILDIFNSSSDNIATTPLSYPLNNGYFLGDSLSGVTTNSDGTVKEINVILLAYFVKSLNSEDAERSDNWLTAATEYLSANDNDFHLIIHYASSLSLVQTLSRNLIEFMPNLVATYILLMFFCIASVMMLDCVRSQPWVALAGEMSVGMAVVTSMGSLAAFGVTSSHSANVMPFLILGIGIDDMFVMLSCWRQTNCNLSTEERMGQTMKLAAISITVTSITDALAFGAGTISPFRGSVLLCIYTVVGVLCSYGYAVTFLAACMVYSGRKEGNNIHSLTCCYKATPKHKAEDKSKMFKLCCTGGTDKEDSKNIDNAKDEYADWPFPTVLFKKYYAPFIVKTPVKIVIGFLYVIYISIAIWGCTHLKEGTKPNDYVSASSYVALFLEDLQVYFVSNYGPRVMVAFTESLDYSDSAVKSMIYSTIQTFQNSNYFITEAGMTESWFIAFENYLSTTNQTVSGLKEYINILTTQFLKQEQYGFFEVDIDFNDLQSEITASRFLIQAVAVKTSTEQADFLINARKLVDCCMYNITIFHQSFILYDQYILILESTIQTVGIAIVAVLIVALILLSSLLTIFLVVLSVFSTLIGVVGYMALWSITLNPITSLYLSMCIGFSVDFTAHICYHYASSMTKGANEKTEEVLLYLGHPILQGAVSTILGVVVFAFRDNSALNTFFKIIFLVIIFGIMHGIVILPVVLSLFGGNLKPACCKLQKKKTIQPQTICNVSRSSVRAGWI